MREDWVECKFDKIFFTTSGGTPSRRNENYYIGDIPWIKSGELRSNVITAAEEFISEDAVRNSSAKIFPAGTILLALYGATIGKIAILGLPAATNQAICGIFETPLVVSKYAYFFLVNKKSHLIQQGIGGAQPNISQTILKNLDFSLPPLPEQRAIVKKLESLFSSLDAGIADFKKAQQQLKIYRQAVLKKAFEGELTKEWRSNNKGVKPSFEFLQEISNERLVSIKKKSIYYKKISSQFNFKIDENIPSWAKATLDNLIYIAARIGWRGLKKEEYTKDGPLFLSVHSLNYGKFVNYDEAFHITEDRYRESPEIQLLEGDVLLCKDGAGIGKLAVVRDLKSKATVNSSLLVIRGLEILNQDFIYYLFSGPKLQTIVINRITGSATPHLFQNDIKQFELSVPPYEEQVQIVKEIETRLSVCDFLEQNIKESLTKSEALRQSVLKKAFEGDLLTAQELAECRKAPDYEPASLLLERIKAEQKEAKPEKKAGYRKEKVSL